MHEKKIMKLAWNERVTTRKEPEKSLWSNKNILSLDRDGITWAFDCEKTNWTECSRFMYCTKRTVNKDQIPFCSHKN